MKQPHSIVSPHSWRGWELTPRSIDEEQLQSLFVDLLVHTLKSLDDVFGETGLDKRLFQFEIPPLGPSYLGQPLDIDVRHRIQQQLPKLDAWKCIKAIYDFGVKGMPDEGGHSMYDINKFGRRITALFSAVYPDKAKLLNDLVFLSEGRLELERPLGRVTVETLVALAGVDARTVRNAMAAGDLAFKKDGALVEFDPSSARQWLVGRRGFVPTKPLVRRVDVDNINTQAEFAQLLTDIRVKLNADGINTEPPVDPVAMTSLERGLFTLPLDSAFPLADYFGIRREPFLKCVMRVFFPAQYALLSS
ncbi:hypothetical protein J8I87_11705 [Paraburkholderia sp. LEh10]|uniref:hypothetical protein n=1 Tax=Paraburkholderia sp. LEh10 TaxID=2821353 RepID=UPI001AE334F1|nr:hypothetical protein [Paraburkholderia sp. LEh10]MBP0590365.1 hypothetical protein [Paraburkholderia sp. LEh10]